MKTFLATAALLSVLLAAPQLHSEEPAEPSTPFDLLKDKAFQKIYRESASPKSKVSFVAQNHCATQTPLRHMRELSPQRSRIFDPPNSHRPSEHLLSLCLMSFPRQSSSESGGQITSSQGS